MRKSLNSGKVHGDRSHQVLLIVDRSFLVYTTTNRRLLDPTAERLENYWWRIWGSQKRSLRGATVARLFVEISNGTSFVPLLGPADHDESGTRPVYDQCPYQELGRRMLKAFRIIPCPHAHLPKRQVLRPYKVRDRRATASSLRPPPTVPPIYLRLSSKRRVVPRIPDPGQ
jgi:hypothetical protein